jgi:DNA-binding NtrC family response regulator
MSQRNQTQWHDENLQYVPNWVPEGSVVLVIEPHAMWRIFLKAVLTLYKYQVVTAATEQEAEARKQEIDPADLSLVITDIHLNKDLQAQAGIRLFERWTATAPTLPFLLTSNNADDVNLPVIHHEMASFLAKPLIRLDVLEAVAVHLLDAPRQTSQYDRRNEQNDLYIGADAGN